VKNEFEVRNNYAVIFVNCKGQKIETMISISDLEKAQSFPYTWYAYHSKRRDTFIIVGNLQPTKEGRKRALLTRWIMDPSDDLIVDHINHNTLDNRRENLRILTNAENQQNRVQFNKWGQRRGVCIDKSKGQWVAYITINKKRIHLGQFKTEEEANKVVVNARKKYMPYSPENKMEG
jgi:hypothetical protein